MHVTLIAEGHVENSIYDAVRSHFTDNELADLTFAVATINAWNRLAISARMEPGKYQPAKAHSSLQPA